MGIIIVFFLALVALVFALGTTMVDTYRAREDSYQLLRDEVKRQNVIIELIAAKMKVSIPSGL